MILRALLPALLASPALAAQDPGGFQCGDLYLYNPAFQGGSSTGGAIVRIEPGSGTVTLVVDLTTSVSTGGQVAYDPFRDRLIFYGGFVPNHSEVWLSDAAGNVTSLGLGAVAGPKLGKFAPRGDGIVYFNGHNNEARISYFDAADQVQTLMNASGSSPYAFPGHAGLISRLRYDAATDSLLAATNQSITTCPGGSTGAVSLYRLRLSADGSRVIDETCFQYDLDPMAGGEAPVGLAAGPQGDLLLTIDNNNSDALPRMARVDVGSASAAPFASNGNTFAAATNAGCYSHVLGKAVILDTGNDVLRTFAAGEIGSGTVLATGVSSPGGSNETATLIEVLPGRSNFGLAGAPDFVSVGGGGIQGLELDLGPQYAGLPYLVLGSLTGWTPGFQVDGVDVPLVLDTYFLYTLGNPNTAIHQKSFGLLDADGTAEGALKVPAGSPTALVGITGYHAALVLSATGVTAATNPVPVLFIY